MHKYATDVLHLSDADAAPGVRGISAAVKRFLWTRDGGQCTFKSQKGRRCPERRELEFHHDDPYGFGGDRSASNVRLTCTTHNMHLAEKDYGKEKMDQYRRSADWVREPSPSFDRLFPDGAHDAPPFQDAAHLGMATEIGAMVLSAP